MDYGCIIVIINKLTFCLLEGVQKISSKSFGAMVMSALVNSTIFIVIVKKVYQTMSKRNPYKRRTVQHCRIEAPLRILACFRNREAVRPVLDLVELSRPVIGSPLSVFAVNLEELNNHSLPLLIHHTQEISPFTVPSRRDQIIKAFHNYEKTNPVIYIRRFLLLNIN